MKAILMSVHAKWCALMMNGDKTIEVREGTALYKAIQKLIDEYGYADIYVYCCKNNKKHLYPVALLDKHNKVFKRGYKEDDIDNRTNYLNGKVIFKFRCYKVEEIMRAKTLGVPVRFTKELPERELCVKSCLTPYDFKDYLGDKIGCAIHISDLEIFDRPKELSEFYKVGFEQSLKDALKEPPYPLSPYLIQKEYELTKAPQSFMYIEVGE